MARIRRLLDQSRPTVYHVMSRTALDGFPLGDIDKDILVGFIRRYAKLYFVDILGFCVMGNHFHLMVRMYPENHFSDFDQGPPPPGGCALTGDTVRYRHTRFRLGERREGIGWTVLP